jgi:ubiquinone/menaquinone biosynthesis C-methylase UbiE
VKAPIFDSSWSQEMVALYKHDVQEIWDDRIAIHIWNQYQNQLSVYKSYTPSDTGLDILDVGCAQATLALQLAEAGHRVSAVDLRQEFLDYAASRYEHGDIEFIQGNVLELRISRRFDLIFANQIVEHLVYPMEMLETLKKLLKAGERLVVTTPNFHYLMSTLPSFTQLGDPRDWEGRQFSADGDGHFFAYQEIELYRMFCRAGMEDVETQFFESPWICGHMKLRYLHGTVPVGVLRKLDKFFLTLPVVGKILAHQLLVTGVRPQ